jgi:hypothetical protein
VAVVNIAQAAAASQVSLVRGIALSIVTVDAWIAQLPFVQVSGGAITYNRESVAASAAFMAPAGASSATQAQWTRISEPLTRIEALAQIDNFAAIAQSDIHDQIAINVAAKAKAIARLIQQQWAVGAKSGVTSFNGLRNLVASAQKIDPTGTTSGSTLTFALLDRMLLSITSADGRIDFLVMHGKMINKIRALYRALGGATADYDMQVMVPDRFNPDVKRPLNLLSYAGVPIYRNDWVSITETTGAGTGKTSIFAGQWEDISAPSMTGVAGMMPERLSDAFVVYPPWQDNANGHWNVRMEAYTGSVLYSDKSLAALANIDSTT